MQGCGFCCFNLFKAEERDINDLPRSLRSVRSGFSVFGETAVRLCCFVTIGDVHRGDFLHRGGIHFLMGRGEDGVCTERTALSCW